MRLLDDMVAMRAVCGPPDEGMNDWYSAGGGLRRRLVLLARCATVLATLHDRGIVYCDVSPGNVLISARPEHEEVWLVDADNLQTESSTVGRRLATPFYAAPEVLRGTTGNTVFSDAFSLAVMVYEALTNNHPLLGDHVADGPLEFEDDAQRGLLPWIDHSTDDLNRNSHGYPAKLVLTRKLRELSRRAFEEGMVDLKVRPSAGEWADALYSAADRCVLCRTCAHSFYAANDRCPWCGGARPPVLPVAVVEQFPPLGAGVAAVLPEPQLALVLQPGRPLLVTARTVIRSTADPAEVLARLEWDGGPEVQVTNVGSGMIRRVPRSGGVGRELRPGRKQMEPLHDPWELHFGAYRKPHRSLQIQPLEAERAS
ncbi:MAG: hypothetical protein ABIQ18_32705 [Umezawaea sp.]